MMYIQSRATFYVQVTARGWHTFNNAVPIYDLRINGTAGIFVASPKQLSL